MRAAARLASFIVALRVAVTNYCSCGSLRTVCGVLERSRRCAEGSACAAGTAGPRAALSAASLKSVLARRDGLQRLTCATDVPETHSLISARCAVNDGAAAVCRAEQCLGQQQGRRPRHVDPGLRGPNFRRASASTSTAVIWMSKCKKAARRWPADSLSIPRRAPPPAARKRLPARALAPGRSWWLGCVRRVDGDGSVPVDGPRPPNITRRTPGTTRRMFVSGEPGRLHDRGRPDGLLDVFH